MKVDALLGLADLARAGDEAARLEALGYDGGFTFEGQRDPFFPLALASQRTERLELYSAIAVAFARSPMLLAQIGHDLQVLARGRFRLGLGSQVRAHIERRFSQPWSRPAARMRELILAVRHIWACWNEGARLDFRGEFYTHTLMTPFFRPPANPFGAPPIWLAGVGPRMTEVAGEVADGFLVHPLHTPSYVRDVTLPALRRGSARAGTPEKKLVLSVQVLVVSGRNQKEIDSARAAVRNQIAFYGSTPAYRAVLDGIGRGDLHPELHQLSKSGAWAKMAERIDDELLESVAVCAPLDALAERIHARCGAWADRVSLVCPAIPDPGAWSACLPALQGGRR